MKVVNKKMSVTFILMLVVIETCTLFLMYKSYSAKETKLDEVNLQERLTKDMFAIMIEQDDGTYKESSDSTWPTSGYKFNADMSGCIDVNGSKLDGALSYDATNNIATVDTGSTSYCYLYFSLPSHMCDDYENATSCLINETDIWQSTLEEDGYRYTGTNPNNYMCFGTSNKATCTGNTDAYMYRIIGIFEDANGNEHLKLIKKEALNTAYAWHSGENADVDWDGSDLYKGLNGSYFLTKTTYSYMQNNAWQDKIMAWNWTATNTLYYVYLWDDPSGINYGNNTSKVIYLHELNRDEKNNQVCYTSPSITSECDVGEWKTVVGAKIGLMYVSDYVLSLGESAFNYTPTSNYETLKTGWMHLSNNDSGAPSSGDWTMSRYGYSVTGTAYAHVTSYNSYYVSSSGNLAVDLADTNSVRPVFYLTSDVEITGGTGISTDPYIIG